jgi:hypothetical protein
LLQLGEVISMNRQLIMAWMGVNWTNRAMRLAVVLAVVAFGVWMVVHFGHQALPGYSAGPGNSWAPSKY